MLCADGNGKDSCQVSKHQFLNRTKYKILLYCGFDINLGRQWRPDNRWRSSSWNHFLRKRLRSHPWYIHTNNRFSGLDFFYYDQKPKVKCWGQGKICSRISVWICAQIFLVLNFPIHNPLVILLSIYLVNKQIYRSSAKNSVQAKSLAKSIAV